jgi:hypothetical protein
MLATVNSGLTVTANRPYNPPHFSEGKVSSRKGFRLFDRVGFFIVGAQVAIGD